MASYSGSTPLPGATWQQDIAIDLALSMVDAAWHDGLKRQIFAILGGAGFSDQQMRQAIARVLFDHAHVYVPSCLFPAAGLTCSETFYLLAGLAAVSATGKLAANANHSQMAKTTASIAATLAADATPL